MRLRDVLRNAATPPVAQRNRDAIRDVRYRRRSMGQQRRRTHREPLPHRHKAELKRGFVQSKWSGAHLEVEANVAALNADWRALDALIGEQF